jgi:hypothetical protein
VVFSSDSDLWYPDSRFLGYATTRFDGTFLIRRLPPGEYYVASYDRIEWPDSDDEWQSAEFLETLTRSATRITLAESQKVSLALTPR